MANIPLPKKLCDIIVLSEKLIKAHEKHSNISPLNDAEISLLKKMIAEIKPKYLKVVEYRERADNIINEVHLVAGTHKMNRKITKGTVRFILAQSRDILKGVLREDLEKLSDWGFEVIIKKNAEKEK